MDLSMPRTSDNNAYIHKKFGHAKRAREDDCLTDWQQVNIAPNILVGPGLYMSYNFVANAERASTPFSTDSNYSADYASFATHFNATSTPSRKRQRLQSDDPFATTNSSADSGIALTLNSPSTVTAAATATVKVEANHYKLKHQLPVSKLTQAPLEHTNISEVSKFSPEKIFNTPVKRRYNNQNRRAIKYTKATRVISPTTYSTTSANKVPTVKTNTVPPSGGVLEINANVIKSVLKPTPVGTLELPAAPSNATASTNPMTTAAVLTSISEDKLRSICTYHTNMVRKFPKKERSPKDQERRNKNTIACRMSRRVKKLQQIAIEQQCKQFELQQSRMREEIFRATALLEQLEALNAQVEDDEIEIDVVNVEGESNMVNVAGDMLGKVHTGTDLKISAGVSTGSFTGCQMFTIANLLRN